MDYEKKYKDALKKFKEYFTPTSDDIIAGGISRELIEDIFPELKESEDERIKNKLIKLIKMSSEVGGFALHKWEADEMLAWLEKQGQKPQNKTVFETTKENVDNANKVEPKFKVGDWVIVSTAKGNKVAQIASVEYFKDGHPSYITTEGRWFGNGTKARLLNDKDVEITTIPESKDLVNKIKYWSEEDKMRLDRICKTLWKNRKGDTDEIYQQEQDIDWLKSLKQRIGE